MPRQIDLFIFAGESSGDLLGSRLLSALYKHNPNLNIVGVGGPKMRAAGMECIMQTEAFEVMGFIDVFLALPSLIKKFYKVAKAILCSNPKAVLFIDYPGFNLALASYLRKKGYRNQLIHYVAPSVWAWGKKRIPKMAQTLDLLLTIFPFEATYFAHTPLAVHYVGHPLVETITESNPSKERKRCIALFPGSRRKEIERNFPIYLKVVKRMLASDPTLSFALSVAHPKFIPLLTSLIHTEGLAGIDITFIDTSDQEELMRSCLFAIAKSGTVTLELAIHGTPTIVTYGLSTLDLLIAKHLVKINLPYYCIVNIVCYSQVFPELIGPHFTEETLYTAAQSYMSEKMRQEVSSHCLKLRALLQDKQASSEAAQHIVRRII